MAIPSCPHLCALRRWWDEVRPQRVTIAGSAPSEVVDIASSRLEQSLAWADRHALKHRPMLHFDFEAADSQASSDLAILWNPSSGNLLETIGTARLHSRFVAIRFADDRLANGWSGLPVLAAHAANGETTLLLRGGRGLDFASLDAPRVWYLAPNRQIFGGVKILYNHVELLNAAGIPAVLGATDGLNWPAHWFAWNPRELHFGASAFDEIRPRDTVVIPEFRHRDVRHFLHVQRRLLFVQNQGLAREVRSWKRFGYDGVLTLGKPDGSPSFLQRDLAARGCPLPVFAVPNPVNDDEWGAVRGERKPGRILCLPRKGPEFVARLQREFGDAVRTVDSLHQLQMGLEYSEADVYVHTGFPEGLGMPIVESMLAGCIACGFTGGGGLDVLEHERTGYIAHDGDADALVAVVRRALADPQRETIRARGRTAALAFNQTAAVQALTECYNRWLPSLPPPRTSWWSRRTTKSAAATA